MINGAAHSDILHKIYSMESSQGKHDGCKDIGKFNGFGYGQNATVWNCFDSFEEVVSKVDAWFTKHLLTKTVPEAVCFYNTGSTDTNCSYYQKFLSY